VSASDQIGFTITVANNGPGTANNVTLSDPLPAETANGWSLHPDYSGPGTCTVNGDDPDSQELDCSFGNLEEGASATVHVVAKAYYEDCGAYNNTATASADNASSVQASASIQCLNPDLQITKTADQSTVVAGQPIGFTINVSDAGPGVARFVNLTDPLPGGTAGGWTVDAGPSQGMCSINTDEGGNQELDCKYGNLNPGDNVSVHISADTSVEDCGTYDNTATATEYNGDEAGVQASASVSCLPTQLAITKTADNSSVSAGDPIGFSITVTNVGPGEATGVTLSDPLPSGTAGGWAIDSGPEGCSITGTVGSQTLTCSPVDLEAGDSFTVHVSADTSAADCGTYNNTATASAEGLPPVQASASVTCQTAQLTITKTADAASVTAGNAIGFTITVKDVGPGEAKGVTLSDPLPAGTAGGWSIDSGPEGCSISGAVGSQTLTCSPVDLPAGDSYTVHVTAGTSAAACATYNNTATASAIQVASVQASATEACTQASPPPPAPQIDLAVTKVGTPSPDEVGTNITWTMVVTNNGPDTAHNVTLADPLPSGTTYVSSSTTQGSCTGGTVLHCSLGTIAPKGKVTVTLVTTPTTTGTDKNTVTVVGSEAETNTANNTASASVVVNQFTGPTPPPAKNFCVKVSKVTPKQLFVGRKTKVRIHLTKHGKPVKGVRVRIKGPKVNMRTKRSNHKGVITKQVKMKKAGILTFSPIASKRCNTKRVGITGVFTPPVTG
jgi:uncharacterized repeat protein (TIGR01451 family)